jgi:hypothetical protein
MIDRFKISMMKELMFFLSFQIKQLKEGTFISPTKCTHDILKKCGMDKEKSIKTPIGTNEHLVLDMSEKSVN